MSGERVDVLAIDRDGRGDAHIVELRRDAAAALAMVPRLLEARAPFRWIAFLRGTEDEAVTAALASQEILYPPATAGRIGVIEVVEMAGNDLGANVRIKRSVSPRRPMNGPRSSRRRIRHRSSTRDKGEVMAGEPAALGATDGREGLLIVEPREEPDEHERAELRRSARSGRSGERRGGVGDEV